MKTTVLYILLSIIIFGCESENDSSTPIPDTNTPIVQSNSIYEVLVQEDIIYGQGLSHESWNSSDVTSIDMKLDVYLPDNRLTNRPVFLFLHGGGFLGGTKQQSQIVNLANFFASRGWVFVSADYRIKNDFGTVPAAWIEYSSNIPQDDVDQFLAIYPAQRDAKAAMRWIISNSETYNINKEFITVGGGSAGAITALTVGISAPAEYTNELSNSQDPTLTSTHLSEVYRARTIIDLWGSKVALDALEEIYGAQTFFTSNPPLMIVHGTEDQVVPFSNAEDLKKLYEENKVALAFYPIESAGHGPWNAIVDNKRIEDLAFDFIVEQQGLIVE